MTNRNSDAEAIAHFLYWSGYLDHARRLTHATLHINEQRHSIGINQFRHLYDHLNQQHPDWTSWNVNYQKHIKAQPHDPQRT